ncbi:MAG: UxaA family hydrolase, partial [Verrucomicrobiota bacterium]
MNSTIQIDPSDDVVVALRELNPGDSIGNGTCACETIPPKQKAVLRAFSPGEFIRMYGVTVATATKPIAAGGLMTTENVVHASEEFGIRGDRNIEWTGPDVRDLRNRTFQGYHRSNGQVGTANTWIVIPMVFCENRNLEVMREAFAKPLGFDRSSSYERLAANLANGYRSGANVQQLLDETLPDPDTPQEFLFPNVDGIKFLTHGIGCGGTRQDSSALCALFAGYATSPNVAGITVFSLGCQNAEVKDFERGVAERDPNFDKPLYIFEQQKYQSERELISAAMKQTFVGLTQANEARREPAPLSKLTFGMECGASDGFSGVSANPAIGQVADLMTALGGRVILSEFPELCGVEQELLNRCSTDEAAQRFHDLMKRYEQRADEVGTSMSANPSPGNIRDGLITDAIKSAGAAKKGGTSPIVDVLDYTEPVKRDGLSLLCTPGNDVESTTAMAGSGANVMLFSTGLGTPTGNPVTPTLKVASNTELAERMPDIIDFDTGAIVRGEATIEETGRQLLELVIQTASGEYRSKAARL